MNLYLVLAIALGAVSAAPVPEPPAVRVAAETRVIAPQSAVFAARRLPLALAKSLAHPAAASGQRPVDVPLSGAATPRAPACDC